jgi:hypothetical protein
MRRFVSLLAVIVSMGVLSARAEGPNPDANAQARNALNRVMPDVKFDGVALRDCFDFIQDITGANVHVNWRALEEAGITKDTPVTVRLRSVSLRKVIGLLVSEAGNQQLAFYVDQGVIEITTKQIADRQMIIKVYNVQDLIMDIPDAVPNVDFSLEGNGGERSDNSIGGTAQRPSAIGTGGSEQPKSKAERGQALAQLIMETIQPEVWKQNGGTASIRFFNGNLIVAAPRSVHEAIGGPLD